jgi:hypothetical protein
VEGQTKNNPMTLQHDRVGVSEMARMLEIGSQSSSTSRGRIWLLSRDPSWQSSAVSHLAQLSHLARTPEKLANFSVFFYLIPHCCPLCQPAFNLPPVAAPSVVSRFLQEDSKKFTIWHDCA